MSHACTVVLPRPLLIFSHQACRSQPCSPKARVSPLRPPVHQLPHAGPTTPMQGSLQKAHPPPRSMCQRKLRTLMIACPARQPKAFPMLMWRMSHSVLAICQIFIPFSCVDGWRLRWILYIAWWAFYKMVVTLHYLEIRKRHVCILINLKNHCVFPNFHTNFVLCVRVCLIRCISESPEECNWVVGLGKKTNRLALINSPEYYIRNV